jgi:anthranilate phosphoribosyltransferase
MVVCGAAQNGKYLDELSTLGDSQIAEFYQERGFAASILPPGQFPFQTGSLGDLLGGDCEANASIVRRLLEGTDKGPKRDAVLLNAAAALFVGSRARSLIEGWEMAESVIESGRGIRKLEELAC